MFNDAMGWVLILPNISPGSLYIADVMMINFSGSYIIYVLIVALNMS